MKSLKSYLQSFAGHKLMAPAFLLAILAMVILPLPPILLDVLFTFNIVLAVIVILVSVSSKRPLDFSVFPTIILLTTLMRLSLNVASTRVVLLDGYNGSGAAGRVIEAFGHVVIGGNFVVGLVVFIILMIINFVVVTKGAERISEVSARFTLDALPGKQMAIDADLNAGIINQETAQKRRQEIAAEADFYGAMDGASKFVRGDAVAGILILIINMFGGVAIGTLMHGMGFSEAFRQYALLTIGDGLVAQIPALLLSAASAIIVTRVSDSEDMPTQIGRQLLASPIVLFSAAGVMFVLAIVPNMPWPTFMGFSAVLVFAGWRMQKRQIREAIPSESETEAIAKALMSEPEVVLEWESLPYIQVLAIQCGYKLVKLINPKEGEALTKRIRGIRHSLSEKYGIILPNIQLTDNLRLKPQQYQILLNGTVVAEAEIYPDKLMAIPSPNVYGDIDGIVGTDPAYQLPVTWIDTEDKNHALGMGYQVVDCASVIATHVHQQMQQHLAVLIKLDDVHQWQNRLNQIAPKLNETLSQALNATQVLKVFRKLLEESVSLKDNLTIASTLLESSENTKDTILLTAEVRCALKREIIQQIAGNQSEIKAFSLSPELENLLLNALNQAQQTSKVALDQFAIDPNLLQQLQSNMPMIQDQMKQMRVPAILLVMPQLRPILARYAKSFAPRLAVISYNEIPEDKNISLIGTLG